MGALRGIFWRPDLDATALGDRRRLSNHAPTMVGTALSWTAGDAKHVSKKDFDHFPLWSKPVPMIPYPIKGKGTVALYPDG